jgi:hypothetical protein
MRLILSERSRRKLLAGAMLVAFAARALIPSGFMPAPGRPFAIEICPEGFPAEMLEHGAAHHADSVGMDSMDMESTSPGSMPAHHHSGSPSHSEHCVFGTASNAGPVTYLHPPTGISSAPQLRAIALDSIPVAVHLVYLPQPRAPPRRLT